MSITPVILSNIYASNTFGDLIRATDNSINSLNNIAFEDWVKPTGTLILSEPIAGKAGLRSDAIALFKNQTRVEGTGSSLYVQNNAEVATTLYLTNSNTSYPTLYASGNSFINVLSVYSTGEAFFVTGNSTFSTNVSVFGTANINYTATESLLVKQDGTIAGNTITNVLQANNRVNTSVVSTESVTTYTLSSNTAISTNRLTADIITANSSVSTDKLTIDTGKSYTAFSSNTITANVFVSNTAISTNTLTSSVIVANTSIATDKFTSDIAQVNTAISSNSVVSTIIRANNSISTNSLVSDNLRANTSLSSNNITAGVLKANTAISTNTLTSSVIVANTAISTDLITSSNVNANVSIGTELLLSNTLRANIALSSNNITAGVLKANTAISTNTLTSSVIVANTAISTNTFTAENIQSNSTINTRALSSNTLNVSSVTAGVLYANNAVFSSLTASGMEIIGTVNYNNQSIRLSSNTPVWNVSLTGLNAEIVVNRTFDGQANAQVNAYMANTYVDAKMSWIESQKRWMVVDINNSEPSNTKPVAYSLLSISSDKLSTFSNTSSAELLTIIPDATGTGNLVFSTGATLISPNIGSAFGSSLGVSTLTAGILQANTSANTSNLSYSGTLIGGSGIVNIGSGQFYKTSTGLIGIGNTSPAYKLDVYGVVSANAFNSVVANGTAPFSVQSNTLVANLNSDLLDGFDSSYFTNISNQAFNHANSSYRTANSAYDNANSSYRTANAAYNVANSAWAGANASYTFASSTANNAYNTANAAWAGANASYTFASSTANNAYNTANVAWAMANTANTNAANSSFVNTGILKWNFGGTNSNSFQSNTMVFFDGNRLASTNTINNAVLDISNDSAAILSGTLKTFDVWSGPLEIREVNRVGYFTSTVSSISGTTLTVGGTLSGIVQIGAEIEGSGVTSNTVITGYISGSGGAGTYTVSKSQTVGSTAINASSNTRNSPAITFHWASANAAAIRMNQGGHFELRGADPTESGVSYRSIVANSFISTTPNGQPPLSVLSTDRVVNLNSDLLDGLHGSYYENISIAAWSSANAAWLGANNSYIFASSTANNAYNTANAAWAGANASYRFASSTANNSYNTANAAWAGANASYTFASSTANNAYNTANAAWAGANASYTFASSTANNAYNTANAAWAGANASYTFASSTANNAYITANNAWFASNTANNYIHNNFLRLSGGTLTGPLTFGNSTSPNTNYITWGDNSGWKLRFMTNVSGTPTERFSFSDTGNFSAVGSISGNGLSSSNMITAVSPNNGSTGAVRLVDASGNPDAVYIQATNNAQNSQYSSLKFNSNGRIVASGGLEATKGYREGVVSVGTVTGATSLDLSQGNIFNVTLGASGVAFTFTNPPSSGTACYITVILKQDGTGSRTYGSFANSLWTDGVKPVLTTTLNKIDILTFMTVDGGSSYYGSFAMANLTA